MPKTQLRIEKFLRREIAFGHYAPGERLPDRKRLLAKFRANNDALQNAFSALTADGFIRAVSGHGTHVAKELPFANRYLLLLKRNPDDAGSGFFQKALQTAAALVARRRGIDFEAFDVADATFDSAEYDRVMDRVRRQLYRGVFAQDITRTRDMDTVMNMDDVPMVVVDMLDVHSQGKMVRELGGLRSLPAEFLSRCFAECREAGLRRVAVFAPEWSNGCGFGQVAKLAGSFGLELVRNGFHTSRMEHWSPVQFERLAALFADSAAGSRAEAVVLAEDNFLEPFTAALLARHSRAEAARKYRLFSWGNFPCCPESRLPVTFHGADWERTLDGFVDYVEAVRTEAKRAPVPVVAVDWGVQTTGKHA